NFKISGIISSPQYTRRNRTGQIFFVNKRFVTDNLLNLSLERGYGEALAQGEHPYAVIFLEFQPDKIDVNIHPQKLQVKFSNPHYVYNTLVRIIRESVRKFSQYSIHIQKFPNLSNQTKQTNQVLRSARPNQSNERILSIHLTHGRTNEIIGKPNFDYQRNIGDIDENLNSAFLLQSLKNVNIKTFLIVKNRYIIFEDIDGIAIIDFHAAHERIIYERLKEKKYETVSLIIPIRIKLSKSLIQLAEQLFEEFKGLGFSYVVNRFEEGSGEIEIRQIPSILKIADAADVFLESLEEYRIPFEKPETLKEVLATKACKAAVKTNDRLSEDEVHQLIVEVKDKQLLTCPHGRPILMKLSFTQIDSYFERI
ncbi:MAG: DNA mismatch repair protein MutL, partial [Fervidobacterium sp.]